MSDHSTESKPKGGSPKTFSAFVPVLILALGMLVASVYNYSILSSQAELLERQMDGLATSAQQVEEGRVKARRLLEDLLSMAETDQQAAAIVQKHRIQRIQNLPAPPAQQP